MGSISKEEPKRDERTTEDYIRFISGNLSSINVSLAKLLDVQSEQNRILNRLYLQSKRLVRKSEIETVIIPDGFELVPSKKDNDNNNDNEHG